MSADNANASISLIGEAVFSAFLILASSHVLIPRADRLPSACRVACTCFSIVVVGLLVRVGLERLTLLLRVHADASARWVFSWRAVVVDTVLPPLVVLFAAVVVRKVKEVVGLMAPQRSRVAKGLKR